METFSSRAYGGVRNRYTGGYDFDPDKEVKVTYNTCSNDGSRNNNTITTHEGDFLLVGELETITEYQRRRRCPPIAERILEKHLRVDCTNQQNTLQEKEMFIAAHLTQLGADIVTLLSGFELETMTNCELEVVANRYTRRAFSTTDTIKNAISTILGYESMEHYYHPRLLVGPHPLEHMQEFGPCIMAKHSVFSRHIAVFHESK